METELIRWGILGAGNIARRFARSLGNLPDACLAAISGRNREKLRAFADEYPADRIYTTHSYCFPFHHRKNLFDFRIHRQNWSGRDSWLARIFDKFYQADTAHSSTGNGLGLPLVQRIVQLSGGNIHVSSQMGMGTTFNVTLPIAPKAAISS